MTGMRVGDGKGIGEGSAVGNDEGRSETVGSIVGLFLNFPKSVQNLLNGVCPPSIKTPSESTIRHPISLLSAGPEKETTAQLGLTRQILNEVDLPMLN